jgi:hypothetical protein
MFRKWMVLSSALLLSPALSHAATIGVAGDSFDMSNPAYVSKLESSGHSFREISNFNPESLAGLDAVWLDGFSAFFFTDLDLSSPNVVNFVDNGGLLLVQSPGFGAESADQYPFGQNLSVALAPSEATIRIRQADPWLKGVTEAQLSGWSQSEVPGKFVTIGDWTGLADNGVEGDWVTIGRHEGAGAAVYTFQDISRMMFDPKSGDAIALLDSIIPVPEPSTFALLLLGGTVAVPWFRRHRKS